MHGNDSDDEAPILPRTLVRARLVLSAAFVCNAPTTTPPDMNDKKKYDIEVRGALEFIADQSDVENDHFVFAYTMTIRNTGTVPAQLIARHWIITDAGDKVQEVRGLGVVGHQPLLQPGEL